MSDIINLNENRFYHNNRTENQYFNFNLESCEMRTRFDAAYIHKDVCACTYTQTFILTLMYMFIYTQTLIFRCMCVCTYAQPFILTHIGI